MKRLICMIDDDSDDIDVFKEALNSFAESFDFLSYHHCKEAIESLTTTPVKPDFIFLDLNMHPVDGIECLKRIKALDKFSKTPVIIYSTTISDQVISQTALLGASGHFEKPTKFNNLVEFLKTVL